MGTSIRLGKIFGIPIGINYSWVFVFLLFTYLLGSQLGDLHPDWPSTQQWFIAVITTILFFASVLAHELSHSILAMHKGIPVHGITLFIFGGVSQLAHDARRPLIEFLVAVVGPLSSIFLGIIFLGLRLYATGERESLEAIFETLTLINFSLGIFNMLPGFPLDGGRVLRAAVWGITGSHWRATQVAAYAGQVIGGLMILGGFLWLALVSEARFQGLWLALIGGFLFSAATSTYRQERARETLKSYRVSDVMTSDWWMLPGDTPLGSPLVVQHFNGRNDLLGVQDSGRVLGIVTLQNVTRIPQRAWPYTSLAQVMTPVSALPTTTPEQAIYDALEQSETTNRDYLAVWHNGVLRGFISRDKILRYLRQYRGAYR